MTLQSDLSFFFVRDTQGPLSTCRGKHGWEAFAPPIQHFSTRNHPASVETLSYEAPPCLVCPEPACSQQLHQIRQRGDSHQNQQTLATSHSHPPPRHGYRYAISHKEMTEYENRSWPASRSVLPDCARSIWHQQDG